MKNAHVFLLWGCLLSFATEAAQLATISTSGEIPVQTWKARRDARVVKQNLDFSCGAAALATLLNEFYGQSLTEGQILKDMGRQDMMANFEDMARVVSRYGFKAGGVALGYEQLSKLTVPVVVYLSYRGEDHFSVLRGISPTHVQLADPSWGNRVFSATQFQAMWETRDDEKLKGKILLILPQETQGTAKHADFFVTPAVNTLPLRALSGQRH